MADPRAPRLCVLIDADNVPSGYAAAIFEEISGLGEASVRRIYGDWSAQRLAGWARQVATLGLVADQQFSNTKGKNASDIGLVIAAMDFLHSGLFDGFVLVSSDSDFTRLAARLREQGMDVYGIGQQKTPEAFRMACKRFIYVENLIAPTPETAAEPAAKPKGEDLRRAEQLIETALKDVEDDEGWAGLGGVGSQLNKRYPDFDPRTYGHRKLSELIAASKRFEMKTEGKAIRVRLAPRKAKSQGKGK